MKRMERKSLPSPLGAMSGLAGRVAFWFLWRQMGWCRACSSLQQLLWQRKWGDCCCSTPYIGCNRPVQTFTFHHPTLFFLFLLLLNPSLSTKEKSPLLFSFNSCFLALPVDDNKMKLIRRNIKHTFDQTPGVCSIRPFSSTYPTQVCAGGEVEV